MPTWTDPGPQDFDARLETAGRGGCAVAVPLDVAGLYGVQGRVPGKGPGDEVHVRLELDLSERSIVLDPSTEQQLDQAGLLEMFRAMSYSHQREYAEWIGSAKKDATRADRVTKLIAVLTQG